MRLHLGYDGRSKIGRCTLKTHFTIETESEGVAVGRCLKWPPSLFFLYRFVGFVLKPYTILPKPNQPGRTAAAAAAITSSQLYQGL